MVLKEKLKSSGFTLVEILVAMAIFSIVTGVAIGVFATAMKLQRKILAEQQVLDQTSYALEYMSRAIRMAKKDLTGSCLTSAGAKNNYETDGSRIRFLNYMNKCQEFFSQGGQLKEQKSTDNSAANFEAALPLTSDDLSADFKIASSGWDQDDNLQPAVTMFLDIEGQNLAKIQIQTTISQRNLDVKY